MAPYLRFAIPGQTIAKKNSQRIVRLGRRAAIRPSKAYDAWEKAALMELVMQRIPAWQGSLPVELRLFFFRQTRAKFDLSNMVEGVQDVLQKAGVLADDAMTHVVPVIDRRPSGYGWAIDKENPRVEVHISAI